MANILIAEDDASIRTVLMQALKRVGHHVEITPTIAHLMEWLAQGKGDVVITDVTLLDGNALDYLPNIREIRPEIPIIVMSANNTFLTAVRASEQGAFEYLPKPFDLNVLIETVNKSLALKTTLNALPTGVEDAEDMPLIGRTPAMQDVYRMIARLNKTDLSVMILGESGTGKERVARALHDYGQRKSGPFVALNMAAIPRDLIESELFGHERGAFTGAQAKQIGRFEQAQGGTLFLDEIGDMPLEAQTRLLRVLQEGEYTTVGGRILHKTDVRIVAASNKDLLKLVAEGTFREDLYYRLCVVPITLPPLRARIDDVGDLVAHFTKLAETPGGPRKFFTPEAITAMKAYNWPGNVRELENFVRRICALYTQDVISETVIAEELPQHNGQLPQELNYNNQSLDEILCQHIAAHIRALPIGSTSANIYDELLPVFERPLLREMLHHTNGNQIKAAALLGINRNTLRKKLQMLGVDAELTKGQSTDGE